MVEGEGEGGPRHDCEITATPTRHDIIDSNCKVARRAEGVRARQIDHRRLGENRWRGRGDGDGEGEWEGGRAREKGVSRGACHDNATGKRSV
jgi:hypothetical protein